MKKDRQKTSAIWKLPLDEFKKLVKESNSYREILKHFGKDNKGGNQYTLNERIFKENIDDSHIKNRKQNEMAVRKI